MSHARIEEVSDSDLSDPSEGDIDDFADSDILVQKPSPASRQAPPPSQASRPQVFNPLGPGTQPVVQPADIAGHQCLYPIYFDAARTRSEGRRVPASLAVKNPLAREIANACAALRLRPVFHHEKTHPQDWANPGRVSINLRDPANPYAKQVKNKHHLYILVAQHLQKNPTTDRSPSLRQVTDPRLLGQPEGGDAWPRPAVPKGWKLNELVPAFSRAMTGGGVSENAFGDMMKVMGGAGGPGGMPGGMPDMANMMSMFGGGAGPSGSAGEPSGAGGSTKKAKKVKGKG